jgi:cupin fold WbuC family metalloprotein
MPEVFRNSDEIVTVGPDWLQRLKDAARASPLRRSRLCLHRTDQDTIQEMIIVLMKDVLFRPHRHLDKSESFHIVEGELYVLLFSETGQPMRAIHMGPAASGRTFCYRLCTPAWHAILPISDLVVMHETTRGPFVAGEAAFAAWAPTGGEELRAFLVASLAKVRESLGVVPAATAAATQG